MSNERLQLQYGINVHADHIYDDYEPLKITSAYPDPHAEKLRMALAGYTGVAKDMIMCGNGSDELIDVYIRAHVADDSDLTVAFAPPMYYQYPVYAERAGARTLVLANDRSILSPQEVQKRGGVPSHTVIMLDNPSNPAGDVASRVQIIALLDAGYQLFVDEAYYEFYGETVVDLIYAYPKQLVVSRTLSKFCAMSGSRLGYIIGDQKMIKKMMHRKMLFNVNSDAQHRGLFALSRMADFHTAHQALIDSKQHVVEALKKLAHFELFPSLDLYVIFKHKTMQSPVLHQRLCDEYNIETYLFDDFKGESVIRAATLKKPEMNRLVGALAQIE